MLPNSTLMGLGLGLIGLTTAVPAATIDHVLLVRNANSAVSMAVAADYSERRGIQNVLTIRCPDSAQVASFDEVISSAASARRLLDKAGYTIGPLSLWYDLAAAGETIKYEEYLKEIERPLRAFLADHPDIDMIVLTKGVPIRIRDVPTETGLMRYSLDSYLAALDYDKDKNTIRIDIADSIGMPLFFGPDGRPFHAQTWANKFWNSSTRFSHALFGGYLVTRLDGYTESDAKALTARCLEAERNIQAGTLPKGATLLDVAGALGHPALRSDSSELSSWNTSTPLTRENGRRYRQILKEADANEFNSDMLLAAVNLLNSKIPVELNLTDKFVGDRDGLMGYVSWGSNDPKFAAIAYHSLHFAPGAIAETAVSTSARSFLLRTDGGQSLIADLVAQGVSGVKGYSDEPLLQAVASPRILFERYTHGWTLAESFYAASSFVGWQDIVIGDPLCRAYPTVSN